MRARFLVLAAVFGALIVQSSVAPAAPKASTLTLCGQIKNGPYDAWSGYLRSGKHVKLTGKTWTVSAIPGSLCSFAMKSTPALLKLWARNALLTAKLKGFLCGPVPGSGPKETRGGSCSALTSASRFSFTMYGQLTIAQIKQELGIK
jgi:hypothetical protein